MNQFKNIPEELKQLPQWVCRGNKVPFNLATGEPAKAGQPATWARFEDIGFEFNHNGIVGIDLDHVFSDDGMISDEALAIVEMMDSYTQYSPSVKDFIYLSKVISLWMAGRKASLRCAKPGGFLP